MAKILLLGGTGTLSTAVLQQSLRLGHNVTIMNRGFNNSRVPENVNVVIGDFKNKDQLIQKFSNKKYDVVVDFLSRVPSDIERVYPVFKNKCQQFIFISSACVYRRDKGDIPIKENSPKPNKDWSYNTEKYECELKLRELSKEAKSYFTIIRPYITYNEKRIPLGIAPSYNYHRTLIERFRVGKPWFTWDDGSAITTVTHVDNFAVGVVGLFLNEKAKNEDFHITGDQSFTQREMSEITIENLKSKSTIANMSSRILERDLPEYASMLKGDRALDAKFDNSKIKAAVPELNFNITYEQGLERITSYWDSLTPLYDYKFEARIDRMLNKNGIKTKFCKYPGADSNAWKVYMIYKHLPLKLANRLMRWL